MSTISIKYDDQQVCISIIGNCETIHKVYIDKHTEFEDVANQLYDLLDEVAGSFDVEISEGVE